MLAALPVSTSRACSLTRTESSVSRSATSPTTILERRATELGNGPARYHDWDTLLAEEKDLDAVIIALPHKLHAPAILAAAKAGKHIMCEKPMCMTLY